MNPGGYGFLPIPPILAGHRCAGRPMAWPRHGGTASLCFRLRGPSGLGSPEIRWREPHSLFGSPEKAALALGSGLACF